MSNTTKDKIVLFLTLLPGIGRQSIRRFLTTTDLDLSQIQSLSELQRPERSGILSSLANDANKLRETYELYIRQIEHLEKNGISMVSIASPDYPECLRGIEDPPVILFSKGNLPSFEVSVAVIGTRKPTGFGREISHSIGSALATKGYSVVSGLAVGCDVAAQTGCVDANGRSVAVLAHGLHTVYPKENRQIAEAILRMDGCHVAEYPYGKQAFRSTFVERDRIQSGLSFAVVVIETGEVGGTMHTVRFARSQGRAVYCLRHPRQYQGNESVQGNMRILESGATGFETPDEIAKLLDARGPIQNCTISEPHQAQDRRSSGRANSDEVVQKKRIRRKVKKSANSNTKDQTKLDL